MKICTIIAEYNPFHNGHMEQIEYVKSAYPDAAVIVIMSGNCVQRGELAIIDKYSRAQAAIRCGADCVFELPYPYSCSSAGYFANAGVVIADRLGSDFLCFGSECGDIELLSKVARRMLCDEYTSELNNSLEKIKNSSESYINSYRRVYFELYGEEIPEGANNTLAIEYLKSLYSIGSDIIPLTNKRVSYYSATASRQLYRDKAEELCSNVPKEVYEIYKKNSPVSTENISQIILWELVSSTSQELAQYMDVDIGLASRLISCAADSKTLAELYQKAATKKYTDSRVRRAVFNCVLKVSKERLDTVVPFTLLLAANSIGCKTVREIKHRGNIEIITKPADYLKCSETVIDAFLFSRRADTLFALAKGESCSDIMKRKPVII